MPPVAREIPSANARTVPSSPVPARRASAVDPVLAPVGLGVVLGIAGVLPAIREAVLSIDDTVAINLPPTITPPSTRTRSQGI